MAFPWPPSFRPRRFSRPRRLPPLWAPRACFIPLPRPGFTLQGVSQIFRSKSSSLLDPFLPFRRLCLKPSKLSPASSHAPNSKGFCKKICPLLIEGGLGLLHARSPLVFSDSLRLSSNSLGNAFTPPPLSAFLGLDSLSPHRRPLAYQSGACLCSCPHEQRPSEFHDHPTKKNYRGNSSGYQ